MLNSPQEPNEEQTNKQSRDKTIRFAGITLIFSAGLVTLVTAALSSVGQLNEIMELFKHFQWQIPSISEVLNLKDCTSTIPTSSVSTTSWVGTRIEQVERQQLPGYCPQTTLILTDRNAEEHIYVRNVDQDLASIKRGVKKNSGTFTGQLQRTKNKGVPVCLELYGTRNTVKSEYMNIVKVNFWPTTKNYDSLSPEERDEECRKHKDDPGATIVSPN